MVATLQEVLASVEQQGHGLAACNVFGFEDASAIIVAAEEVHAPIVLMTNKAAVAHMGIDILAPMLLHLAAQSSVQVCVHLDHGTELEVIKKALDSGYSSVMFDGSQLPMEENVAMTREVSRLARQYGASVEAEIGAVGYSDPTIPFTARYTTVQEAQHFCEHTDIDALAVAIGTVHRMEEQGAVLQFDLLQRIHAAIAVPLVIHGASGVSDTEIPKLIACGARKVNIGTALRMAFGTTLRELFIQNPGEFDRLKFYPACMEAVRNKAKEKLLVLQQPYDKELKI